ncbi:helix-turn-helix domain-containing protein [uncultured Clostridium sp.]|uniref:helix-turn-helix domain-containing protein n=1 Tax=uncultured Clostridium sp. TaxID=59620 RepID=UPI0025E84637|nr:helix-turn-helix transcriptional regulator [uncultured Clostridium sp.]
MNSINIGEKIENLRKFNKISRSELARRINVSPAYITMLENGKKTNPSIEVLRNIATALAVPVSTFLNTDTLPVLDNEEVLLKQQLLNYLENYHNLKADAALSLCDEIIDYTKMRVKHFKNKRGE